MKKPATPKKIKNTQRFCWQTARDENISGLEIDPIVQHETSSEQFQYCELFLNAANSSSTKSIHKPALLMLSAIMSMRISSDKFDSKLLKFEALGRWNNGSRSSQLIDFTADHLEIIRECIKKTQNIVVKTRLEHLVWILDRRDSGAGQRAIDGYIEMLEEIYSGNLHNRSEIGALGANSTRTLKVLTNLHKYIIPKSSKEENIKKIIEKFFRKSLDSKDITCILRFGEIAVHNDRKSTISAIERFISKNRIVPANRSAELWNFLASMYRFDSNKEKYYKYKKKEAEVYVTMAKKHQNKGSANDTSSLLKRALKAYHNIPGVHRKYEKIRHMLVEVEKDIPAEMLHFESSVNLSKVAHSIMDEYEDIDLSEALMKFKDQNISFDSSQTRDEAIKWISQFPFRYSFRSELTDDDGKVIAVSNGVSVDIDGSVSGSLDQAIMEIENFRRSYHETGTIGPARSKIAQCHRVSYEKIFDIIRFSPTVPVRYRHTISKGFEYYFNSDWIAAAYILIPMLEGILRHGLLWKGYDVHNSFVSEDDQGGLMSLSKILRTMPTELMSIYDRGVIEDLYRLFCSRWGPTIRHRASHALHNGNLPYTLDAGYACWLIWKVSTCHLFIQKN